MKIKLVEIANASVALKKIDSTPLEVRAAYRLHKILNKLMAEIKDFEKVRNDIIVKNGIEDPKTKRYNVPPENLNKVATEIEKLMETEIDLDVWQIPMSLLEGRVQLSSADIASLEKFLVDDKIIPPVK